MKNIQVFTKARDNETEYAEVNGELVSYATTETVLKLKTKDEEGSVWEYVFPLWNVSMVRISDEPKE